MSITVRSLSTRTSLLAVDRDEDCGPRQHQCAETKRRGTGWEGTSRASGFPQKDQLELCIRRYASASRLETQERIPSFLIAGNPSRVHGGGVA